MRAVAAQPLPQLAAARRAPSKPLNPRQSGRTEIEPLAAGRGLAGISEALVRRSGVAARIVFADGTQTGATGSPAQFVIRFRNRRGELRALRYGHVGLLEA